MDRREGAIEVPLRVPLRRLFLGHDARLSLCRCCCVNHQSSLEKRSESNELTPRSGELEFEDVGEEEKKEEGRLRGEKRGETGRGGGGSGGGGGRRKRRMRQKEYRNKTRTPSKVLWKERRPIRRTLNRWATVSSK